MYNPSENTCRDIIPYQDPMSVILKNNTNTKEQLLVDIEVSASSLKWILENELTEEGFSFVSTRADSKFFRIIAMRSGNCITLSFTNSEGEWIHNHGCGVEHPTIHSLNEMKSFLLSTANMNEPEFNHRLEKLVKLVEKNIPDASYNRFSSQSYYYHTKNISDMIIKNFGRTALMDFYRIKPPISLPKYYSFLRKSTALKDEISSLVSNPPNIYTHTADDILKLQTIKKLSDLRSNSALWQYKEYHHATHALVRNLLSIVKDDGQPSNRSKSPSF